MTRVKLCGLTRPSDIEYANSLLPDYIGFVFAQKSRRYIPPEQAAALRAGLDPRIAAVGVFVDETPEAAADLVKRGIIDIVQLHGSESSEYIARLRSLVDCPVIQAFRVEAAADISRAEASPADFVLLDSGGGSGRLFDHALLSGFGRQYFLAGGLSPENAADIIARLKPFAVDASSSLETDGYKDLNKMTAFVRAVRKD